MTRTPTQTSRVAALFGGASIVASVIVVVGVVDWSTGRLVDESWSLRHYLSASPGGEDSDHWLGLGPTTVATLTSRDTGRSDSSVKENVEPPPGVASTQI